MANIQNELNNIKTALYGKDVRNSIHDAIKTCYDDASVNNDNANMEVKLARGTHNTLNDRLCEVDEKQNSLSSQLEHVESEKYSINGGKLNGKVVININNKELQIGETDSNGNFILKTTKGSNIYIIPELEEGFGGQYRRVFIGGELRPTENAKFMNGSYDAKWEEVNTRFLRVELNEADHGSSIADFAQNNASNSGYIRIFDGSSGKTNTGIAKLLLGFIRKWNKSIINSNGNNLLLSTDLTGSESKKHIEITSENADILPSASRLQNIGSAEKRFENIYIGGYVQTGRFATNNRPQLSSTNSGAMIFDNTIQKPIWWTGTKWINANGETV